MTIYLLILWICVANATSIAKMNMSLSNLSFPNSTTSSTLFQLSSSSAQIQSSSTLPYDAISRRTRLLLDCSSCSFIRFLDRQAILLIFDSEQCTARKVSSHSLHSQQSDSHSKKTGANIDRMIIQTDQDWARILKPWILPPYSLASMIPRKAFAFLYKKPTTVAGFRKAKPLRGDQ